MEQTKKYSPQDIEIKWYAIWEEAGYFKPNNKSDAPSYSICLPPPNVTGTLHMGHGFQHSIQDVLIRYHRMRGFNTLWQPGVDHAGIATQIVVERQLEAQNIDPKSLTRDEFIEKVWQWKEYSGSVISRQMRRLGVSCDFSRERFTMDTEFSQAVIEVFVRFYERGFIYRGKKLVNWDTKRRTAVSDLEVVSKEENGNLWYLKYPVKNSDEYVVIATTRPETMLGDVAVAVNPNDSRYQHLLGQFLILPLTDREIPVIADKYVDMEFGTGCVKITPAHDFNDYELGKRHNLPMINIMTLDGRINNTAPLKYQNLELMVARKQVVADLKAMNLLDKVVPHKLMVPRGERDEVILEPMLTEQWFMNMDQLAEYGLNIVEEGGIKFVPETWKLVYKHWLENIQDWCISRQLLWGHRIPAYYNEAGDIFVARNFADAVRLAGSDKLIQDADVLDTWFSASLWCFVSLGWPKDTPEINAFLPTQVLVTGFDIIFFWVARTIMVTNEFTHKVPFKTVYVTGLIQDAHGQKMSKSKGNIIDPLDLIEGISVEDLVKKRTTNLMNPKQATQIEKQTTQDYPQGFMAFGADALRFTFLSLATNSREIRFDIRKLEATRNFCNKVWNAGRFVMLNTEKQKQSGSLINDYNYVEFKRYNLKENFINSWIILQLQQLILDVEQAYNTYRFDILAHKIYEFVWNDYCDWYLELVKVDLMHEVGIVKDATIQTIIFVLDVILRVLHPITPFITEEIWQELYTLLKMKNIGSIMVTNYPVIADLPNKIEGNAIDDIALLKELITGVRNLRATMKISPATKVPLILEATSNSLIAKIKKIIPYLKSLAKLTTVEIVARLTENNKSPIIIIAGCKLMLEIQIDPIAEKERLSKEQQKLLLQLEKIDLKLNNEQFVAKAPKNLVMRDKEQRQSIVEHLKQLEDQLSKYTK